MWQRRFQHMLSLSPCSSLSTEPAGLDADIIRELKASNGRTIITTSMTSAQWFFLPVASFILLTSRMQKALCGLSPCVWVFAVRMLLVGNTGLFRLWFCRLSRHSAGAIVELLWSRKPGPFQADFWHTKGLACRKQIPSIGFQKAF